tara:strand:- start:339 stop:1067 length:729 start_codon:yes stop_codon:yes gene_type:complete
LKKIIFFIFINNFILSTENESSYKYIISFLSIPSVELSMSNKIIDDNTSTIIFSAKSISLLDNFFKIDNYYSTVYNVNTFKMLEYTSNINQPNAKYDFKIKWNNENKQYEHLDISYERPKETNNIFSLLQRVRFQPKDKIDAIWIPIEHEGTLFNARFLWVNSVNIEIDSVSIKTNHFRLDLEREENSQKKLKEISDVFNWGITLDNSIRQIWIEREEPYRIIKAEVDVRGLKFKASLKNSN